jgi:transposase-like protein
MLLGSGGAHRFSGLTAKHRSAKALNDRTKNYHQPTRGHKRGMHRVRSVGMARRDPSAHGLIANAFSRPEKHGKRLRAAFTLARSGPGLSDRLTPRLDKIS